MDYEVWLGVRPGGLFDSGSFATLRVDVYGTTLDSAVAQATQRAVSDFGVRVDGVERVVPKEPKPAPPKPPDPVAEARVAAAAAVEAHRYAGTDCKAGDRALLAYIDAVAAKVAK